MSTSIETDLCRLQSCRRILEHYGHILKTAFVAGGQEQDPPAIMLHRAFQFGERGVNGMQVLMTADSTNAVFAASVCRGFYETAVRLRWASTLENGWQRLQAHWASEDKKWAADVLQLNRASEMAKNVLDRSHAILERTDDAGARTEPAPSVIQMLKHLADAVPNDPEAEELKPWRHDYAQIYRILCHSAHWHMSGLVRPSAFVFHHATMSALSAVSLLMDALVQVAADNQKEAAEIIVEQLTEIFHGREPDLAVMTWSIAPRQRQGGCPREV